MSSARQKRAAGLRNTAMPDAMPHGSQPQTQPEPPEKKRLRHPVYWTCFALLCVFLLIKWLAYSSQSLSDRYLNNLTPKMDSAISRITYLCPLPIYELTMFAAILGGFVLVVLLILLIFLRKKAGYRKFMGALMRIVLVIAVICFAESEIFDRRMLSSSVLGHPDYEAHEHTLEEVCALYNQYIADINETIVLVDRDENHHLIRPDKETVRAELSVSRQKLQGEFSRFQIDPPDEKTSLMTPYLDTFGTSAYTVSPSMEIVFSEIYENHATFASVYAHEFSHFCGYWREDEANYLAYRLCMASDNPNIRYAALMDLFYYVSEALDQAYFGTTDESQMDQYTPEYNAFCDTLTQFTDPETLFLFICDRSGNYKLYHELREEEVVVDEKPEVGTLPDAVAEIVTDAADSHWENLQDKLGAHYYDGVVQLLLDERAGALRS